jgi:hypothetical protein
MPRGVITKLEKKARPGTGAVEGKLRLIGSGEIVPFVAVGNWPRARTHQLKVGMEVTGTKVRGKARMYNIRPPPRTVSPGRY